LAGERAADQFIGGEVLHAGRRADRVRGARAAALATRAPGRMFACARAARSYGRIMRGARRRAGCARAGRGRAWSDVPAGAPGADLGSFQMSPNTKSTRPWQSSRVHSHGSNPVNTNRAFSRPW